MASAAFEPARAAAQLPAMCAEAAALMKPDAGALEAVRTVFATLTALYHWVPLASARAARL
jgi:hypothetical protein